MVTILETIQIIGLIISLVLTAIMVFTFRKPRLVTSRGKLISIAISLAMLFSYLILTGTRLNARVSIPVFIVGLVVGCIRGFTLQFSMEDGMVTARGSWFFLLAWGGSWLLIQLVAIFASSLLLSISLIPVFLSTGIQVGLDGIILVRRIRFAQPVAV